MLWKITHCSGETREAISGGVIVSFQINLWTYISINLAVIKQKFCSFIYLLVSAHSSPIVMNKWNVQALNASGYKLISFAIMRNDNYIY